MSRSLRLYFDDILISCDKILRYSEGLDYESFMGDELRVDATLRNLQIIGEAIKQV
ncbi:HepT-like ribonuclease domain-containing protein, partial [Crocosphaera sp.]|uniref:HepT-like ribonuclease domain-containing protein n=1 Tax=Crocosphaera sp. TaxID=2729996 RepID=UPI00257DAB59